MSDHLDHLSYTQARMFERCGLQWLYRYGLGEKRPPGVALLIGSSTHAAIDHDLTTKLQTGALAESGAVAEIAADSLRRRWQEETPVLDDDEQALGEERVQGLAIDQAVALATLHHTQVAPGIEPTHVERTITLGVQSEEGGYDIVTRLDVQTAIAIHDTKTAGKSPSQGDMRSPQFGLYRAAVEVADGRAPDTIVLDALVKTVRPKAVRLEATVSDADADAALDRIGRVHAGIKAGIFLPADPTSWVCTPKFCGYWASCPQGARKVTHIGFIDRSRLVRREQTYAVPEDL